MFTFQSTETKNNYPAPYLPQKESRNISHDISPLRVKKSKNDVDEPMMGMNESIFGKEKDLSSIRNSYNYMENDTENVSFNANQPEYSMTQKFDQHEPEINLEIHSFDHNMHPKTAKNRPQHE